MSPFGSSSPSGQPGGPVGQAEALTQSIVAGLASSNPATGRVGLTGGGLQSAAFRRVTRRLQQIGLGNLAGQSNVRRMVAQAIGGLTAGRHLSAALAAGTPQALTVQPLQSGQQGFQIVVRVRVSRQGAASVSVPVTIATGTLPSSYADLQRLAQSALSSQGSSYGPTPRGRLTVRSVSIISVRGS